MQLRKMSANELLHNSLTLSPLSQAQLSTKVSAISGEHFDRVQGIVRYFIKSNESKIKLTTSEF